VWDAGKGNPQGKEDFKEAQPEQNMQLWHCKTARQVA